MYGLVNRGIEELVCTNFGEEVWEKILEEANLDVEIFLSMEQYDDAVTYALVAAASKVLNISAEDILMTFGEYWTLYTAQEGYGDLMKLSGSTLAEFLMNLDNMHVRVGLQYPELAPPSFRCTDVNDAGLTLHYHSHRAGLAPLVIGLLRGLGKMFRVNMRIDQDSHKNQGADHDVFQLTYLPATPIESLNDQTHSWIAA